MDEGLSCGLPKSRGSSGSGSLGIAISQRVDETLQVKLNSALPQIAVARVIPYTKGDFADRTKAARLVTSCGQS